MLHLLLHLLNYKLCNETSMKDLGKEFLLDIAIEDLYCIDMEDLKIGGSWNAEFINYVRFDIHLCKDGIDYNETNINCTSFKEFEDLQPNTKLTKNILITVGVILVFAFVFIVSIKQEEKLNKEAAKVKLHEITIDKLNQKLNSDEKFVLLLGRPDCSHCVAFKPIITKVANDKGIDVYYLNVDTIETYEDWETIWGLVEQEGTPTVAVIEKQQLVLSSAGEMTEEQLIEFFKEAGVL